MTTNQHPGLFSERLFSSFFRFLWNSRIPFFSSLIFGLLAHMFAFTNKLLNHDALNFLFSKGITISSGRWGLVFLAPFLPDSSLPWLNGTITVFLIALSVCLMIRMFSIRNTMLQVLLAGLVISFPSLTGTFSYMFTSAYYGAAFLFSVLAVYLIRNAQRENRCLCAVCLLAALALSVFSTAIYQAYIAITAGLLLLLILQELLEAESDTKILIRKGIGSVLFLALSLGCYWICCKVIWSVTDIPMNQYSQEAVTFQLSTVLEGIKNAYLHFFSYTLHPDSGLVGSSLSRYFHLGCLMIAGAELALWAVQSKKWDKIFLMVFLLAMLPLSINCMYIFIAAFHVHTLVLYSFIILYVFAVVVMEYGLSSGFGQNLLSHIRKNAYDVLILGLTAVLVSNIYTANTAYLKLYLRYENFYAFCTSTVSQLQNIPDYSADTPVAFVGTYEDPAFYSDAFPGTEHLAGINDFSPNAYSRDKMFEYYIGHELNLVHDGDAQLLSETAAVQKMPEYPASGYVRMVDGTIVIKLSD